MRNQMLNNPRTEEIAGKIGRTELRKRVSTEERKEITTRIRKNKEKKV